MVKKFTLLELHLDDATFSNAVGSTPAEAEELLDAMETDDESEMDESMDDSGSSGIGRALRMAAVAVVVAVGVRTIARRLLGDDDLEDAPDADDSVEVDLDEPVEA